MVNSAKVSKYAVGLVVASGVIWVVAGVAFGGMVAASFPSIGSLISAGVGKTGYPPDAVRNLAWDQFYINLYAAIIGLFAIIVGLKGFRRGEIWAWYAVLLFITSGLITSVFDYLSWGRWYTIIPSTLPALSGLLLSTRSFFPLQVAREK